MVREFQKIIGEETKIQIKEQEGRLQIPLSPALEEAAMPWESSIPSWKKRKWSLLVLRGCRPWHRNQKHAAAFAEGKIGGSTA